MNTRRHHHFKKIRSQNDFPACKKTNLLLKTKIETAMAPSQQQRSFEFTSLFERWSISAHSQAGGFLLRCLEARGTQSVVALRSRNHKMQVTIS
jgi:hypothetical protein